MRTLLVAALLLFLTMPAGAHHSFAADFDAQKPVNLVGIVKKVEWTNPHAHVHLDVKDRGGVVTTWNIELGTPNSLARGGWRRDSVKVGDTLKVNGYAAKNGSPNANARTVLASDGHQIFARAAS